MFEASNSNELICEYENNPILSIIKNLAKFHITINQTHLGIEKMKVVRKKFTIRKNIYINQIPNNYYKFYKFYISFLASTKDKYPSKCKVPVKRG